MSHRNLTEIQDEHHELRSYLSGLPAALMNSGAFVSYQPRETQLQDELIAAKLASIAEVPVSSRPECVHRNVMRPGSGIIS